MQTAAHNTTGGKHMHQLARTHARAHTHSYTLTHTSRLLGVNVCSLVQRDHTENVPQCSYYTSQFGPQPKNIKAVFFVYLFINGDIFVWFIKKL